MQILEAFMSGEKGEVVMRSDPPAKEQPVQQNKVEEDPFQHIQKATGLLEEVEQEED
jgi:hypothetical protein